MIPFDGKDTSGTPSDNRLPLPKPQKIRARQTKIDPFSCAEIKTESDLLGPGAAPGTIPTDLEQATGLERLEILGKMQGIDIFDMKPLPSDRVGASLEQHSLGGFNPLDQLCWKSKKKITMADCWRWIGTFEDPIVVRSAGDEIQCGCTGCPSDSHDVRWVVVSLLSFSNLKLVSKNRQTMVVDVPSLSSPATDPSNAVTNAGAYTKWTMSAQLMTRIITTMATKNPKLWPIT